MQQQGNELRAFRLPILSGSAVKDITTKLDYKLSGTYPSYLTTYLFTLFCIGTVLIVNCNLIKNIVVQIVYVIQIKKTPTPKDPKHTYTHAYTYKL